MIAVSSANCIHDRSVFGSTLGLHTYAVLILDSRFGGGGGEHIWGVNSMHFLMFFCILGVFLGGGDLGFRGGGGAEIPPRR